MAATLYWCHSRAHPTARCLGGCVSPLELCLCNSWLVQHLERPWLSAGWKPSLPGQSRQGFQRPSHTPFSENCHATWCLLTLVTALPRGFFYRCGCGCCALATPRPCHQLPLELFPWHLPTSGKPQETHCTSRSTASLWAGPAPEQLSSETGCWFW